MRAFVLSGGGNRGALQVGALRALLEREIYPEMLVGCSAGALNAAFLAQELSLAQVDALHQVWASTRKEDVYPGGRLRVLWRLLSGQESLYDNRNFYAFLQRHGISPALTFGALVRHVRLYITATDLDTETLHVFGDHPGHRVLDALMASTALPPLHPPWTVDGRRFIDGGTVTPLPLRVALERGADEVYALHIWNEPTPLGPLHRGLAAIVDRSISTMLRRQAEHDLLLLENRRRVRLHRIRLEVDDPPGIHDWNQTDRLVQAGYEQAIHYLEHQGMGSPAPGTRRSPLRWLSQRFLRAMSPFRKAALAPVSVEAEIRQQGSRG